MNKKRYWLKFGLIFFVVAFAASLPGNFVAFGFSSGILGGPIVASISSLIIFPVQIPLYFIGIMLAGNVREYMYLAMILLALVPSTFYFVIGVIIGGIYGKIKNKNSSADPQNTINVHDNKKIFLFCVILILIGLVYIALVSTKISHRPASTFIIQ